MDGWMDEVGLCASYKSNFHRSGSHGHQGKYIGGSMLLWNVWWNLAIHSGLYKHKKELHGPSSIQGDHKTSPMRGLIFGILPEEEKSTVSLPMEQYSWVTEGCMLPSLTGPNPCNIASLLGSNNMFPPTIGVQIQIHCNSQPDMIRVGHHVGKKESVILSKCGLGGWFILRLVVGMFVGAPSIL